jgi:broad specificity phosphatase PhoE
VSGLRLKARSAKLGMTIMTLLLIRHGQTEWNVEGRYQGRLDSPLTERGIAQAEAFGRCIWGLPEMTSAEVVASPLTRALRTAEIICRSRVATPIRLDARLREVSLGSWDGLTREEIKAHSPAIFEGDGRHDWYFRSPDGETYVSVAARLGDWLNGVVEGRPTVVVTHGIVTRVLCGIYAGLPWGVAMRLPVPQDKMFYLTDGGIGEISVRVQPDERPH